MTTVTKDQKLAVRVEMTVEVDVNTWVLDYGAFPSAEAIRRDVRTYIRTAIEATPAAQPRGPHDPAALIITRTD